jgi:hypothetical protein
LQAKADYLTRYYYGGRDTIEVVNFINNYVDNNSLILAPPEIVYYSNNNTPSYYYLRDLLREDESAFIKAISDKKVAGVVYGIASQAVDHFTNIINKYSVQEALRLNFKSSKIGSYTVWLRMDRVL